MNRLRKTSPAAAGSGNARIELLDDAARITSIADEWKALCSTNQNSIVDLRELERRIADSAGPQQLRVVVVLEGNTIVTIAPFVLTKDVKKYTVGERKLFHLPARQLRLIGKQFVGEVNEERVRQIFDKLLERREFDLVCLGELPTESRLYRALCDAKLRKWRVASPWHQPATHWRIKLPPTFDAYLEKFGGKTRRTLLREMRIFKEKLQGRVQCVSRREDVGWFLRVGEQISRKTYQWNVGQRLCNDAETLKKFINWADASMLRCYMLWAGDKPCAFARGTIQRGVFSYETPGFDPEFAKSSPGTVLLMHVIEDLILHTDCDTFDFGIGGDNIGYKSRFGNDSYSALMIELGIRKSGYSMLLLAVQDVLVLTKRIGKSLLGDSRLRRTVKRLLRKYGE